MFTNLDIKRGPHIVPLIANNESTKVSTLWLFNIAMKNGPFIDGLPIKNCDFPWLCQS